jgi:hypothetical protein
LESLTHFLGDVQVIGIEQNALPFDGELIKAKDTSKRLQPSFVNGTQVRCDIYCPTSASALAALLAFLAALAAAALAFFASALFAFSSSSFFFASSSTAAFCAASSAGAGEDGLDLALEA